jgi:hypothetical protein
VILAGEAIPGLDTLVTGMRKTEANYSTFEAHYEARQPKRIEDPLKGAVFWEKLNQGEERVTRKRVSRGIRKEKARGPVTVYGRPHNMGKWRRAAGNGRRSRASGPSSSTATRAWQGIGDRGVFSLFEVNKAVPRSYGIGVRGGWIGAMRIVVISLWIQERVGRAVHKKRGVPRPGWGALLSVLDRDVADPQGKE